MAVTSRSRHRFAAGHLDRAGLAHRGREREHVVALDDRDAHRHAELVGQCLHRRGAALRVHAAGVADDADALLDGLLQHRAQRHRDEVDGVAFLRPLHARAGEDRHRQLGEIVEHQVVDAARAHQLRRPEAAVAPEARGAADAHELARARGFQLSVPLRFPFVPVDSPRKRFAHVEETRPSDRRQAAEPTPLRSSRLRPPPAARGSVPISVFTQPGWAEFALTFEPSSVRAVVTVSMFSAAFDEQ